MAFGGGFHCDDAMATDFIDIHNLLQRVSATWKSILRTDTIAGKSEASSTYLQLQVSFRHTIKNSLATAIDALQAAKTAKENYNIYSSLMMHVPEYLSLFPPVAHTSSDFFKLPFELNAFDFDAYTKVQLFDATRAALQASSRAAKRHIFLTIVQWLGKTCSKTLFHEVIGSFSDNTMGMLYMCNLLGLTFEPHCTYGRESYSLNGLTCIDIHKNRIDIAKKYSDFDFSEYSKKKMLQAVVEALTPVPLESKTIQEIISHHLDAGNSQHHDVPMSVTERLNSMLQAAQAAERPTFDYDRALVAFIDFMQTSKKAFLVDYLQHWPNDNLIPVIVQIVKEKPLRPLRYKKDGVRFNGLWDNEGNEDKKSGEESDEDEGSEEDSDEWTTDEEAEAGVTAEAGVSYEELMAKHSVKELRAIMAERGIDNRNCIEKGDLAQRIVESIATKPL